MVVFGVAVSNMTTQSLLSIFGLLFLQKLSELEIGTVGASVILSVQTSFLNFSGLFIGPIIAKLSYRKTAAVGAALISVGLLLTILADSLLVFVITYSFFTGLGLGLLNPSTFVAIDSYFSSRKGRAVGVSLAGTGIGQMLLPILTDCLLREYGFQGTLLMLSSLALHAFLGATLYQPVKWHFKSKAKSDGVTPPVTVDGVGGGGGGGGGGGCGKANEAKDDETKIEIKEKKIEKLKFEMETEKEEMENEQSQIQCCKNMNLHLLKDPTFLLHITCLALVYVGNITFSMLLPFFLENIQFSRANIAICMTTLSGGDTVGRLVIPMFTDVLKIQSKTTFFLGAFLSALIRLALVFQNNLVAMFVLSAACGFVRSAIVLNFNLSISELVSSDVLASALGLHMIFKGVAIMIFTNLVGFLRDYTKDFLLCMVLSNGIFLGAPVLIFFIQTIRSRSKL